MPDPHLEHFVSSPTWEVREGDALKALVEMPAESVQCCVTSPPYFGLRDYGVEGQIGLEATPDEYVARLVDVFREVRRVLVDDGTLWLNLGDSYNQRSVARPSSHQGGFGHENESISRSWADATKLGLTRLAFTNGDLKEKDLFGIPWWVAFALRADGWYLRSDIIWHKTCGLPESVGDRPTRSHEHIFLLSKRPRYYYDADAIREPDKGQDHWRSVTEGQPSLEPTNGLMRPHTGIRQPHGRNGLGRNKRDVWSIPTHPYPEAHFATFPPKLIEPCILAGARTGDVVLDPFAGSGTSGVVALRHGRSFVGIELSPTYAALARERIRSDSPLMNSQAEVAAHLASSRSPNLGALTGRRENASSSESEDPTLS